MTTQTNIKAGKIIRIVVGRLVGEATGNHNETQVHRRRARRARPARHGVLRSVVVVLALIVLTTAACDTFDPNAAEEAPYTPTLAETVTCVFSNIEPDITVDKDTAALLSKVGDDVTYSISVGFRARAKASQSPEEYFLAGRSVPGWKSGLSMAATQYAADTPLLVTGLIATAGLFAFWRLWIYGLAFLMMGFVLGRAWRRAGVLTDAAGEPVIYDPACYYGDHEADLAMMELFGHPGESFFAAYREHFPIDAGYGLRRELYNLYHILNHANLFGGSYAARARSMIDRLLAV